MLKIGYLLNVVQEYSVKTNQRDLTPKLTKGYQLFLHIIHSLNLIHISTKFHQDILNTCIYIVMKHTKVAKKYIYQRSYLQK